MALLPPSRDPHPHAHPADAAAAQMQHQHDEFLGAYASVTKCTCTTHMPGSCPVHGWLKPLADMQPKPRVEPSRPFETTDFPTNEAMVIAAKRLELECRMRRDQQAREANLRAVRNSGIIGSPERVQAAIPKNTAADRQGSRI